MGFRVFICVGLAAALAAGCSSFNQDERKMIMDAEGGVMRVLKSGSPADEDVLRGVSGDLRRHDVRSECFSFLARSLRATVNDPSNPGVGIAAPQIGVLRNVIMVQRFDKPGEPFELMVNPEVTLLGERDCVSVEGCLSVDGVTDTVLRYRSLAVSYRDSLYRPCTDTLEGFTAVIVQHETDHLEGILFTDRVVGHDSSNRMEL